MFLAAGQKIIMKLWGDKAASPLHLVHWGFGIGSFIVPQIVNPFLAVPVTDTTNSTIIPTTDTTNSTVTFTNLTTSPTTTVMETSPPRFIRESRIEWGYAISASSAFIVAFIFYVYQFTISRGRKKNYHSKETAQSDAQDITGLQYAKKMFDPATCTSNSRAYGATLLAMMSFFLFNIAGGERVFGKFIRSYAIDELHMTGDDASFLNTSFWISFSVGRFLFFILAKFINIRKLILIEAVGALIASTLVCFLGDYSQLSLWLVTQPMGIFVAPFYPSLFGWGGYHLNMTGIAMTIVLIGGGVGGVAHMFVIGHFYEYNGPKSFLYHMMAYGVLMMVMALMINFTSRGKKRDLTSDTNIGIDETSKEVKMMDTKSL